VVAGPRPMFGRRRRPLLGRAGLLMAVALLVPALLAASSMDTWPGSPVASADGGEVIPADAAAPDRAADDVSDSAEDHDASERPATAVFATAGRLPLHLPAEQVVLVGFHEASSRESQAFTPVGRLLDHQNTTKFDAPPDVAEGPEYVILSSRGRAFPATSAIDVLLGIDEPVHSPVTGTVTDVREYHLYGKHLDERIEIQPADAPDHRVVMIHLDGVGLEVGDEVVAAETVVAAGARLFTFGSHIDRYTEPDRFPHVHYEIKRATED
jgi:murein DD-endopeptidase MepM/ murein hydrolase activator NlpD